VNAFEYRLGSEVGHSVVSAQCPVCRERTWPGDLWVHADEEQYL